MHFTPTERSISVATFSGLDSSLLPHRPTFNSRQVSVGFFVDKMKLE